MIVRRRRSPCTPLKGEQRVAPWSELDGETKLSGMRSSRADTLKNGCGMYGQRSPCQVPGYPFWEIARPPDVVFFATGGYASGLPAHEILNRGSTPTGAARYLDGSFSPIKSR